MNRFPALSRAIRTLFPPEVADLFVPLTYLGDPTILLLVAAGVYWRTADRGWSAALLPVALGGLALGSGLKGHFALARPPVEHHRIAVGGLAFPSGHALGSAVVYAAAALAVDFGTRARRFAAAGLVVGAVALSRVILGVHYLGDVVAGVAVGVAYVAVVAALARRDAGPAYWAALLLAAGAAVGGHGAALLGAAAGGVAGRNAVPAADRRRLDVPPYPVVLAGLLAVLGLRLASHFAPPRPLLRAGLHAVAAFGIVALPTVEWSGLARTGRRRGQRG
jgi:membrane-associated phospholipid phosphatase